MPQTGNKGSIDVGSLTPFFNPNSIAILGASSDANKIGGRPVANIKAGGFKGALYPVNPNYPEIQGLKSYPSVLDIDGDVDMAIVSVPARMVSDAIRQCGEKGIKAAAIFSSGFAEISEEGAAAQRAFVDIAGEFDMRIIGPNCMGTMNIRTGMWGTFISGLADSPTSAGGISLASQSGAFGGHCFQLMRLRGYGLNLWATTGNQADVEFADCLAYMAQDPDTKVVLGYMEGVRDPDKLVTALEMARQNGKPVVMMKVGTSEVGTAAAASHTASLTGADAVFDALMRQYDVYRAHSIDELFDVAYGCTGGHFPATPDLGLITVSGGVGVVMADAAADNGLELPELPKETQERVREMVPFAGTRNPLDVTAQLINDPGIMSPMFDALLEDGGYPTALCFAAYLGLNAAAVERIRPVLEEVAQRYKDRLLVLSILSDEGPRRMFQEMGYLVYEDPTKAVKAIAALHYFGRAFARKDARQDPPALPSGAPAIETGAEVNEFDAKKILLAAGVPAVEERIITSAAEAADAAGGLGFPVVMKIVSPDILHKSEIGGVLLNIASAEDASAGYDTLMQRAGDAEPNARIDGVLVAPMVSGGVETIVGVQRDPVFGPVIMFGLGGIFVEVLKDVTFRIAPFGIDEAHTMIREVKGYPLLEGVRGQPPADVDALAEALARLSVFAAANADTLESIDINPFIVRPKGEGAVAVDALILSRTGS
jgi:acyl-CoA synthetase (NDP forming)